MGGAGLGRVLPPLTDLCLHGLDGLLRQSGVGAATPARPCAPLNRLRLVAGTRPGFSLIFVVTMLSFGLSPVSPPSFGLVRTLLTRWRGLDMTQQPQDDQHEHD